MSRVTWLAVAVMLCAAACADAGPSTGPIERAVVVETEACGHASGTTGSGVIVGDGEVITAAHVVIGASEVRVLAGSDPVVAMVIRLDVTTDLALLRVPRVAATEVEVVEVATEDAVTVVGGASSGTVDATATRRLLMDVDDVRSQTRSQRAGFELDAAILPGDSGAGVFDSQGRLVGIVFAVPTERSGSTFAVRAQEIAAILAAPDREYRCDARASRLIPSG